MNGSGDAHVELSFRDRADPADLRRAIAWNGFAVEHVLMTGPREFAYDWSGSSHYLALHDLRLSDGDTALAGGPAERHLDLRDSLTFAPAGCRVSGWSRLADRGNSYTAITFDAEVLAAELDGAGAEGGLEPRLYFSDPALRSTLQKLGALLGGDFPGTGPYAETLGLLAVLELHRLHAGPSAPFVPSSGALSARQESAVREYVAENLDGSLTLAELAGVASLTRYHFARAFRRSFGTSPHAYVLRTRIERSRGLLATTMLPMSEIARLTGFATQGHFAAAFRSAVGCTPSQFRRGSRDA